MCTLLAFDSRWTLVVVVVVVVVVVIPVGGCISDL